MAPGATSCTCAPTSPTPASIGSTRSRGWTSVRPERSYYERVLTEVVTDDGRRHAAWVYLPGLDLGAGIAPDRRVPGDDWPR